MNNEIKEILDIIKQCSEMYEDNEHWKILLDYITNLQESEAYYYGQYKDYKSRNEKANEFIKEHNIIVVNKEYIPDGISTLYDYELSNILNGKE